MHDTSSLELRLKAQRAALLLLLAMVMSLALLWAQRNASASEDGAPVTTTPPDRTADQTIVLQHGRLTVYKPDSSMPDIRVTEQCDDQGSCTFSSPDGLVSGTITAAPAAAEGGASSTSTYYRSSTERPNRPADQVIELQHGGKLEIWKANPSDPDVNLGQPACDDQGTCTYSTPDGEAIVRTAPAGAIQPDGSTEQFRMRSGTAQRIELPDRPADQVIELQRATARVYKADPNAPDIELTEQCDDQGRCTYSTPDGRFHGTLEHARAGAAQAEGARLLFSVSDSGQHDQAAPTIVVLEPTS